MLFVNLPHLRRLCHVLYEANLEIVVRVRIYGPPPVHLGWTARRRMRIH